MLGLSMIAVLAIFDKSILCIVIVSRRILSAVAPSHY